MHSLIGARMEHRRKPTIIILREHLQGTTIRHAGGTKVESFSSQASENCATPESLAMISQLDEELQNDFRWLIGFDLGTVFLHDIDGDNSVLNSNQELNGVLRKRTRMKSKNSPFTKNGEKVRVPRNFKSKKCSQSGMYSELISQCLQEIGEATVINIYNWIRDKYPDIIPSDISWKNTVRYILTINPAFQKKKSSCGKCHLWYLNKISNHDNSQNILQPFSGVNLTNPEHTNSRMMENKKQNQGNEKSFGLNEANRNPTDGYLISTENEQNKNNYQQEFENWVVINSEMQDYQNCSQSATDPVIAIKSISEEYYIQEIPITEFSIEIESIDYTEPREVKYFLEENAASIPMQVIQEKSC